MSHSHGNAVDFGDKFLVLPSEEDVYIYSSKTAYQCRPNLKKAIPECTVFKLKIDENEIIYANAAKGDNYSLTMFSDIPGQNEKFTEFKNCKTKKIKYQEVQCKSKLDDVSKAVLMAELKYRILNVPDSFMRSLHLQAEEVQIAEKRKLRESEIAMNGSFFVKALENCKPVVELRDFINNAFDLIDKEKKYKPIDKQTKPTGVN